MPVTPVARAIVSLLLTVLLTACSTPAAAPDPAGPERLAADPPSERQRSRTAGAPVDGAPYEVVLVADFGPLPDGTGAAIVETAWTVDATGTRQLRVDTPAGPAAHHVMTDDEHWWWLDPAVRETVADAEWVHFDLPEIEAVGGELPEIVAEARVPLPDPGRITVGQIVAGHEVLAVDVVGPDEVHLRIAGIERAVVHRRRALPEGTMIAVPPGAVDVAELPDVLRW